MSGGQTERVSRRGAHPGAVREIRIERCAGTPALSHVRRSRAEAVLRGLIALGIDHSETHVPAESLPEPVGGLDQAHDLRALDDGTLVLRNLYYLNLHRPVTLALGRPQFPGVDIAADRFHNEQLVAFESGDL